MMKSERTKTLSQRMYQIHELIDCGYDVNGYIGEDVYLFYMDTGNANVTVSDGTFYHFETFDELSNAHVFENGKTLKDVCFELELERE